MNVKNKPGKGKPRKVQPLFIGPYRVLKKVVLRLRHIREGNSIQSTKTCSAAVFHEDSIGFHDGPHDRQTYSATDVNDADNDDDFFDANEREAHEAEAKFPFILFPQGPDCPIRLLRHGVGPTKPDRPDP